MLRLVGNTLIVANKHYLDASTAVSLYKEHGFFNFVDYIIVEINLPQSDACGELCLTNLSQ